MRMQIFKKNFNLVKVNLVHKIVKQKIEEKKV